MCLENYGGKTEKEKQRRHMEGDIVGDTPGDMLLEGAILCQRKNVFEEQWPTGNIYHGRDITPGTAAARQHMPKQMKTLKKQEAVEENKQQGAAERNLYTLT